MTILITGATGAVGRRLVADLLAQGRSVRALTRRPEQAGLPAGAEVVPGDLAAPLEAGLFEGIDQVFVFPAEAGVDHLVESALAAGVSGFVVLSSLAAAAEHPRDIGSASHRHHLAVEKAVSGRTGNFTLLRPGTFANNLLAWAFPVKTGRPIRAPYLASGQAPVHEADVAEAAAFLLARGEHTGEAYPLTGPATLTRRQQIEAIAQAVGRPIEAQEITEEEFRQEFGQFVPAEIIDMLLDYWRDTVDEPDVPRPLSAITGTQGRPLAQWAQDHRQDFLS
ncbi:nucleotide-diphosphate-sugar epimerase [Kineosporia sp. NBRC 101677]|uniref:SDR family oxidoreductase n=1 Tax=Kineosporia sp. NBRC 101677 TaxID=3032197 RepID=UPI0024A1B83B|nr:NAD(P)H-binding protein [Kineosporia sp. NBRC 101677]GLY16641.1 nucleotide-diphosphate-sugar epimerase [Kineosporia sp. NBRC 101677]